MAHIDSLTVDDVSSLSDSDLFNSLKKMGVNPGPVTGSTRSIYERRLRSCIEKGCKLPTTPAVIDEIQVLTQQSTNSVTTPRKTVASAKQPIEKSMPSPPTESSPLPVDQREQENEEIVTSTTTTREVLTTFGNVTKSSITIEKIIPLVKPTITRLPDSPQRNFSKLDMNPVIEIEPLPRRSMFPTSGAAARPMAPPTNYLGSKRDPFMSEKSNRTLAPAMTTMTPGGGDKFASRLDNHGLLREKANHNPDLFKVSLFKDSEPTVTMTSAMAGIQHEPFISTPSNIRSRISRFPADSVLTENEKNKEVKFAKPHTPPMPVEQKGSMVNFKYLLVVGTLIVVIYFVIMQLQSPHQSPVEFD